MADESGGSRRRTSVTMSDVAARAGVALGTVSNALNHPERVTPELLARVHRAIDDLGFVRNSAARSLAAGSSNTVGFLLVDLANSFFVDMARGAEAAAQDAGMYLVMANSDISVDKQAAYLEHFSREQVAGILSTLVGYRHEGLETARRLGRRVVLLDAGRNEDYCCIDTDYELSGYLAAQHLLSLGRRRLSFVGGPLTSSAIGDRYRGALRAVEEHGGSSLEHLDTVGIQAEDGRTAGQLLIDRGDGLPDGVIAAADLVALGLMQSLADSDASIPDDVALIACDDNKSALDSRIPISTVDLPGYQMGMAAMRMLLEEIRSPQTHTHQRVILEPTLTARESTVGRRGAAAAAS